MEQNQNKYKKIISLNNFSFSYGDKRVFDNINFEIIEGKTYGIVGRNGAGKTSLLNILHGIQKIDQTNQLLHPFNEITYIQTSPYFYPYMKGFEYLSILNQSNQLMIEEWNKIFQLPLNQYIHEYSTGMQKKLSILGGLSLQNKILILDEPFNGLDLESTEMIHLMLESMKKKNYTIILTSHILETITRHADLIYYINQHQHIESYEPNDFVQLETIIKNNIINNSLLQFKKLI